MIDDFSGAIEALIGMGRAAAYAPVQGYPGVRSPVSPAYLAPQTELLRRVFVECFGLSGSVQTESCNFSIVSTRPEDLSPGQHIPHYDAADANLIALLHFTGGAGTGGTAFYRHRRTAFEAILPERVARYAAAVKEDDREYGAPPQHYYHGSGERHEMIGEIEAKPDRVIIYRGRLLHSGHIPVSPAPETARETGRLTINTFFVGHP